MLARIRPLTFSFLDATHANQVVMGPSLGDLGVGWQNIAATNSGEGTVYIHVDGVAMTSQEVSGSVSADAVVLWKIGGPVGGNTDFNLRDVVIDHLRISESPRYSGGFDRPAIDPARQGTLPTVIDQPAIPGNANRAAKPKHWLQRW